MRIVIAADKFKGSLSASDVADHLAVGLQAALPTVEVISCPIADGGEGTLDAASVAGYSVVPVTVDGPLGDQLRAHYAVGDGSRVGVSDTRVAVIELAQSSGLAVLPRDSTGHARVDTLAATSTGVGQLITAALDNGCQTLIIGVGGSACTDGGAGMLSALGAQLLDADHEPLPSGGGALARLARVDLSGLDDRLQRATVILAADVDNPLLGKYGAAAVFAPQKGATPEQVAELEHGLTRWRDCLAEALDHDVIRFADLPGAGTAGGAGFAALAVLNAERRSGADILFQLTDLSSKLTEADLVITGEGSLDEQSLAGKAPVGVAQRAAAASVPTVAVCGTSGLSADQLRAAGFRRCYQLTDLQPDPERCMAEAGAWLEQLGERIATDAARPAETS